MKLGNCPQKMKQGISSKKIIYVAGNLCIGGEVGWYSCGHHGTVTPDQGNRRLSVSAWRWRQRGAATRRSLALRGNLGALLGIWRLSEAAGPADRTRYKSGSGWARASAHGLMAHSAVTLPALACLVSSWNATASNKFQDKSTIWCCSDVLMKLFILVSRQNLQFEAVLMLVG